MKLLYIHAYRERFGVESICAVLSEHDMKIAPGTYYKWLARPVRRAELEEACLVNEIVDLYRRNWCVYGVGEDVARRPPGGIADRPRFRSGG